MKRGVFRPDIIRDAIQGGIVRNKGNIMILVKQWQNMKKTALRFFLLNLP
jgi:hypothetical protein